MTLTTLIILNTTLGALVVYGILSLLARAIPADQIAEGRRSYEGHTATPEQNRLAA